MRYILPILFGALAQRTRLPTTTFMFLFGLSAACLVWMLVVVRRMTRDAAPRVAEEVDDGAYRGRPLAAVAQQADRAEVMARASGSE